MKKLTIAVISDVHAGDNARGKDLAPNLATAKALEEDFVESFCDFVAKEKIKPDCILIPGDATEAAKPAEAERASAAILRIAAAMSVGDNRIAFVPGNHDVDWSVLREEDPTGLKWSQRYSAFGHPKWVFPKISGGKPKSLFDDPYLTVWDWPELLVVGYNSSWHDKPNKFLHSGHCAQDHLKEMRAVLDGLDLSGERLKVFMVHHHPVLYSEPLPDDPEYSAMINAENLLGELRSRNFDMIVHGHRHFPRVTTHIVDGSNPLVMVGAGAFSLLLPHKWSGVVANQFHLVEVADRWPDTGCARGQVRSWAYLPTWGWVPSNPLSHGISHRKPFGTYLTPTQVAGLLEPLLQDVFAAGDWADTKMLESKLELLSYVPRERLAEVLEGLGGKFDYQFVQKEKQDFVLLRNI